MKCLSTLDSSLGRRWNDETIAYFETGLKHYLPYVTVVGEIDVSVLTLNLLFSTNQEASLDFCNPCEGLPPGKPT